MAAYVCRTALGTLIHAGEKYPPGWS